MGGFIYFLVKHLLSPILIPGDERWAERLEWVRRWGRGIWGVAGLETRMMKEGSYGWRMGAECGRAVPHQLRNLEGGGHMCKVCGIRRTGTLKKDQAGNQSRWWVVGVIEACLLVLQEGQTHVVAGGLVGGSRSM